MSVRSRQVPDTSLTSACPPSLPSVPTSLPTRVTSPAKERSCATIVLTVFFSSAISPCAGTVISWSKSPWETAVVTSAMLRTWEARSPASALTLSVSSRHVPDTPSTLAWPPSLPSVPTSLATRVTSEANELSWSTIALTDSPTLANSPCTGTPSIVSSIFWSRSPTATAAMTRTASLVGRTRSSISVLSWSPMLVQPPTVAGSSTRASRSPWRPMTWQTRATSVVTLSLRSATRLNARACRAKSPSSSSGNRTVKSPAASASMACSSASARSARAGSTPEAGGSMSSIGLGNVSGPFVEAAGAASGPAELTLLASRRRARNGRCVGECVRRSSGAGDRERRRSPARRRPVGVPTSEMARELPRSLTLARLPADPSP